MPFRIAYTILIALLLALTLTVSVSQKLRLQPELDTVDVEIFIKNPKLFDAQVKCLAYDGECDRIGRFLKPRIARALIGECEFCTPKQTLIMARIITFIQEEKPQLYRELVAKYISELGINIPKTEGIKSQSVDISKSHNKMELWDEFLGKASS